MLSQSESELDFDALLMDLAISGAEIEQGINPTKVARASKLNLALLSGLEVTPALKAPGWTPEELDYLVSMSDKMTSGEIAVELGRTETAVSVKRKRLHLPEMSTARTEYYTANYISELMGLDAHKICWWIDHGLLEGRLQPGDRKIRLVKRIRFICWVTNPENWIYFNPRRMADPDLARLMNKRADRWGDEWWPSRWVADYHHVDTKYVMTHIKRGLLPGVQVKMSLGGRHEDPAWLNWFVKKSDAIQHIFWTRENPRPPLTPRCAAWIVRARDELGWSWDRIGRSLGSHTWKRKRTTGPGVTGWSVRLWYEKVKGIEHKRKGEL